MQERRLTPVPALPVAGAIALTLLLLAGGTSGDGERGPALPCSGRRGGSKGASNAPSPAVPVASFRALPIPDLVSEFGSSSADLFLTRP